MQLGANNGVIFFSFEITSVPAAGSGVRRGERVEGVTVRTRDFR